MRRRNTPLFIAMSDGVLIGLIGALIGSGGLLGTILTFVFQMKKLRSEQKERAEAEIISQNKRDEKAKEAQRQQIEVLKESTQAEINKLEKTMRDTLEQHRVEYVKEINTVKSALNDTNNALFNLQANSQQFQAVLELRMDNLTLQFNDMKTEVREHNNFAKRMPLVEEKIKVANHRLEDLEKVVNEKK